MEKKDWKTLAIIFICLCVLETLLFVGLMNVGMSMVNKEIDCAIICDNNDECISYSYDDMTSICSINGIDDYKNTYVIKSERIV